jgi:hypothetical protein
VNFLTDADQLHIGVPFAVLLFLILVIALRSLG